jgi:hypothetical protein
MDVTATGRREGGIIVAGMFLIKITKSKGEITSATYAYLWSAWLDGKLLGKGHCVYPEAGIERAHDLVSPEEVEHIEIIEPTL